MYFQLIVIITANKFSAEKKACLLSKSNLCHERSTSKDIGSQRMESSKP